MRLSIIAVALVLAGCGGTASPSPTATTHTVAGTVTFTGPTVGRTDCHGVGGNADMAAGTDILVVDGAGATIGKGELVVQSGGDGTCVFEFEALGVPDVPFYSFQIGQREAPTYSAAEMGDMGWTVALAIGES